MQKKASTAQTRRKPDFFEKLHGVYNLPLRRRSKQAAFLR